MTLSETKELLLRNSRFKSISTSTNPALKNRRLDWGFDFQSEILGQTYQFTIGFKEDFPFNLPIYLLNNKSNISGLIPHVDKDGLICHANDSELVVNPRLPSEIIEFTIESVIQTISDGLLKKNEVDFLNEWEAYWRSLPGKQDIFTNIRIDFEPQLLRIEQFKGAFIAISDDRQSLEEFDKFHSKVNGNTAFTTGIYIPLDNKCITVPPNFNEQLSKEAVFDLIYNNITEKNRKKLSRILTKTGNHGAVVILSFQQPNGNYAIFGVRFEKCTTGKHPLIDIDASADLIPLSTTRLDKDYMIRRGGIGNSTYSHHGIIVGCGALGSLIGEELIKAGLLNLTLVDPDQITNDNVYRHVAGFHRIGENKAEALKRKFEQYYPHSQIQSFTKKIEDLLHAREVKLKDYDYIVIATGNPSLNLFLNNHIQKYCRGIPVFYTWIEPYGIGGHCLICNISENGCYNCLYCNDDLHNAASFVAIDQSKPIQKSISGCGTLYTPYGSLDANQSAILAVRMILGYFEGRIKNNALFSWKGEDAKFCEAGLIKSERYEMTQAQLDSVSELFVNLNCPICNQKS